MAESLRCSPETITTLLIGYVLACVLSHFMSNFMRPHGLQPARLLCPWDSPGKNIGVGCHALLQGTFPTQGLAQSAIPQYKIKIKKKKGIFFSVEFPAF